MEDNAFFSKKYEYLTNLKKRQNGVGNSHSVAVLPELPELAY